MRPISNKRLTSPTRHATMFLSLYSVPLNNFPWRSYAIYYLIMDAWYTLYTKPHAEKKVEEALSARGFRTLLPLLPPRRDGRREPLFPAYLFIHCDLEVVGISALSWIPGLRRVLSFGGKPAVVPEQVIQMIQEELARIEDQGGLPPHNFKPGDPVVIDEGPMAGLRGVFQGPVKPSERVKILVDFLGYANRVEVAVESIQRAPEQTNRQKRRGTRGRGRRVRNN